MGQALLEHVHRVKCVRFTFIVHEHNVKMSTSINKQKQYMKQDALITN